MRQPNDKAIELYQAFQEELSRWEKRAYPGSTKYVWVVQGPRLGDTSPTRTMTREEVPAGVADFYTACCAMEDAMERVNG